MVLEAVKRIILLAVISLGAWIWGHWGSLLIGVVVGVFLVWRWKRGSPAGQGGGPQPVYKQVEGYGWMRVR